MTNPPNKPPSKNPPQPKFDPATLQKYQQMLEKDPNSQVFAPLAEAFRESGQVEHAEQIARRGVHRHPNFPGGLVTLGKILKDQQKFQEAQVPLQKVAQIAPENILAHLLLADINLALKNPKEALRSFKMVLLFNPRHEKAQKAVKTLESLTADEYDDDVFSMTKLKHTKAPVENETPVSVTSSTSTSTSKQQEENNERGENSEATKTSVGSPLGQKKAIERMMSLIDALIVRNDIEKAIVLLKDTAQEFGQSPEIERRMNFLDNMGGTEEEAVPIAPIVSRDELVRKKKLKVLQSILHKLESRTISNT